MEMEYLGSEWAPALLGPSAYNEYGRRVTAVEEFRSHNPDRWGRVSGTLVIVLLAVIAAASLVFGLNWYGLSTQDRLKQGAIDALWARYDDLVTQIGEIPRDCECEGVNITFPVEFGTEEFALFDPGDPSRILVFDLEALSAGVTPPQPVFVQNANGTVAYTADIPTFPQAFTDAEFAVFSANDFSTRIVFSAANVIPGSPITLSIQNAGGTVALLDDVVDPTDTTVFPQNQFEIMHAGDTTRKVRFDVDSLVTPGSTTTISVPDGEGIIAYLTDFVRATVFPDDVFALYSEDEPSKLMRFDASGAVSGIPTVMTVQNRNGTLAYLDQILEFVDVDITESRTFPDMDHEGFANLQRMGVTEIMVWMCGGGGGGRMDRNHDGEMAGGGGGGGAGYRELVLREPAEHFTHFAITIGDGGLGTPEAPCAVGGTTVVTGVPINPNQHTPWQLLGFGGACGEYPSTGGAPLNAYGGCGAGSGGISPGAREPGLAGGLGGVPGACGHTSTGANLAPYRFPWQGGAHGASFGDANRGFTRCTSLTACPASTVVDGGAAGGGAFGGAGGMFGHGGDMFPNFGVSTDAPPNSCAGGGARSDTGLGGEWFGKGGSGRVIIRYWNV